MPIAYIGTTSCPENSLSNKHIGGMFTSTFQLHLQPRFTQQLTEQKYSFTVATEAWSAAWKLKIISGETPKKNCSIEILVRKESLEFQHNRGKCAGKWNNESSMNNN